VTVCELGADKGASVLHWCLLPTVRRVVACEVRGTPYWKHFEYNFPDVEFCWIDESSRDPAALDEVREFTESHPIDVLFIDGEKVGMLRDFDAYLPMTNPAGLVFVHDVGDDPGPKQAWDAVVSRGYRTRVIRDVSESDEACGRERRGVPAATEHEAWLRAWRGESATVGVVHLESGRRGR
jgi:hypothetical protein